MATRKDPIRSLSDLLQRINVLKRLPRTGWLLAGVPQAESLADHTAAVALFTLFLAEAINQDWQGQGLENPLDVHRAVTLALLHDLAESVLTDLPRQAAQALGPQTKRDAESRTLTELLKEVPGGPELTHLWHEYHRAASPEARLVKDVDRLEMVHQALCYTEAGHRNLQEFLEGHRWHYPLCAHLYGEMHRHFHHGSARP